MDCTLCFLKLDFKCGLIILLDFKCGLILANDVVYCYTKLCIHFYGINANN